MQIDLPLYQQKQKAMQFPNKLKIKDALWELNQNYSEITVASLIEASQGNLTQDNKEELAEYIQMCRRQFDSVYLYTEYNGTPTLKKIKKVTINDLISKA
jgi:hypothetical protein